MKKLVFSISLCLCIGFSAVAQEEEEDYNAAYANKRGVYLLPQAGDFALGIDATPFLRYLGNIFTSASNSAPTFSGVFDRTTIYGKYFLQDDRAIRAHLTLDMSNSANKGVVPNDRVRADNPDSEATLVDIQRTSNFGIFLGAGYEFRRGNGRVQGFYGGEILIGFESGKMKNEYGNSFTTSNPNPNVYDFNSHSTYRTTSRVTENKFGNTIMAGLGGFAGVEYFFAPQMSIGGQFNLAFMFSTTSQTQVTTQTWNATDERSRTKTDKGSNWNASDISVSTGASGSIFLMFHF